MSLSHDAQMALEIFRRAVASTEASFESLRVELPVSVERVEGVVESLIGHLKTSDSLLVPVLSAGAGATNAAHTAVNVTIFSLRIGLELRYSHPELSLLGKTALLYDIGRKRTPAIGVELEESVKLIRALGSAYAQVADVVVQVLERVNGRGADAGSGGRGHEHAQIVALAATYENLSRQQPKGPRTWPPAAVKEILRRERARFPDAILKALIQISVKFPVGGFVRLNSGEVACVVAQNEGLPLRPVVAIPARQGRRADEPSLIDLRENPFLYVGEFLGYEGSQSEPEDPSS